MVGDEKGYIHIFEFSYLPNIFQFDAYTIGEEIQKKFYYRIDDVRLEFLYNF